MTEATAATATRPTARIYDWRSGRAAPPVPTEAVTLSLTQLALHCGIEEADLLDLVDHGVLRPAEADKQPWRFSADCIANLRRARRLRFGVEHHLIRDIRQPLPAVLAQPVINRRLRPQTEHVRIEIRFHHRCP